MSYYIKTIHGWKPLLPPMKPAKDEGPWWRAGLNLSLSQYESIANMQRDWHISVNKRHPEWPKLEV